jgi:hypothetical protein
MKFINDGPVMTVTLCILIVVAALVGGAVVIWGDPGALSFEGYLNVLWKFALAVAGLAYARAKAVSSDTTTERRSGKSTHI